MSLARSGLASMLVSLCLLSATPTRAAAIPDWYFQAPREGTQLKGVGSGETVAEARQAAVASILLRISQRVQANTELSLQSRNGETENSFRQSVEGESLMVDVGRSEIAREFQDSDTGTVYLEVSVRKKDMVRALSDQLNKPGSLEFPHSSASAEQLLWSLQFMESLDRGLRLERTLAGLGQPEPIIRDRLEANRKKALGIWQTAGVRIVAKNSLGNIASRLRKRIPESTNTVLWLQLDRQVYTRQITSGFEQKQVLSLHLKQAEPPFTGYAQAQLVGFGKGSDKASAARVAEQMIYQKLSQPLANWLF